MKLLDYIRGSRKGKEAHRLEKEAMRDPFLADAMDGYSNMKRNQEENIRKLHGKIARRAVHQQRRVMVWGVAASLLVGLFLGGYFLLNTQPLPDETRLALEQQVISTSPNEEVSNNISKSIPEDSAVSHEGFVTDNRAVNQKKTVASVPEAILQEIYDEVGQDVVVDLTLDDAPPAAKEQLAMKAVTVKDAKQTGSQLKTVHGKVVDKEGEPIIGATVTVKGLQKGAISDLDGNFSLEIGKMNKELAVNYIGYEPIILSIDTGKNMLIAMNEDHIALDEVVVVGYSSEERPSILGSVSSMLKVSGAPQPENGNKAFRQYIQENLKLPTDTLCLRAKGKVVLNFRVGSNGRPTDIRIKKSLCPTADKEAIRLIEEGPAWVMGDEEAKVTIEFR